MESCSEGELELWLPLETILQNLGHRDLVDEAKKRFLSWYGFAAYEPSEFEEAVVLAIIGQFDEQGKDDVTIGTKDIAERMDAAVFHSNDTYEQRAVKVGYAIKKFNLATEKKRGGKGQSYRFHRDKVGLLPDLFSRIRAYKPYTSDGNARHACAG